MNNVNNTTENKFKAIHAHVFNPKNALFKFGRSEPAKCTVYYCEKSETCPLLKKGQCINNSFLGPKCVYGYRRSEEGFTPRSQKFGKWISDKKEEHKDILNRADGYVPDKMVEIGEYLYLPYAHMDMNERVPFLKHSALFVSGQPFIKKDIFNIELIKTIVDFLKENSEI